MPAAQQTTEVSAPTSFGDNRGIKFQIKTGNARWECVLQDRGHLYVDNLTCYPSPSPES